jgi:acyl dehydratase
VTVADASLIGRVLATPHIRVEASKIGEFARAVHAPEPAYRSKEAARDAGFDDIPAPPTFTVTSAHASPNDVFFDQLDLDLGRVLHGSSSWTYHRPVVAGDDLLGEIRVANVYTKPGRQGGEMTFVEIETTFTDPSGAPVVTERMVVIETALVVSD